MKDLAGTLFVYNGKSMDYCFMESINSLLCFCDYVIVVDAGSTDGTLQDIQTIKSDKLKIISLHTEDWFKQSGQEKLNYFTNIAIDESEKMGFKYQFNLQADEIVHENSYNSIRKAIKVGFEAYMSTRINLWHSPYLQLNVPHERKPCSSEIIRFAKTKYRSVGDAESLNAPVDFSFVEDIRIYHMGFVRDRAVMKKKVIHIQEEIFGMDHDKKLDGVNEFIPERWFSTNDVIPISEPLPIIIKEWASKRCYNIFI